MSGTTLAAAPPTPYEIVHCHDSGRPPDAAVIVPVWNGARFLRECCDSIRAQRSVAIEVVIVDDGSTDESCALAGELLARDRHLLTRALLIRHARQAGPAAARDTGMRAATAPAALMLDVDNVIYPRCVRRCLDALESSGAAFVYPMLRVIGSRDGLLGHQQFDVGRLANDNYIDILTMVRRSAWEATGGFPDLPMGLEDYAFWLQLIEHGFFGAQVPEILGAYRAHRGGRTEIMIPHLVALYEKLERAFPWVHIRPNDRPRPRTEMNNPPDTDRTRYIDLLIRTLTNTIYQDPSTHPDLPRAFDPAARAQGRDWPRDAHTMAGAARLANLADLVNRTLDEGIPGDYIETGAWRGGCCILMRAVLAARSEPHRRVFVADSFEGLPPPNPVRYAADAGDRHHEVLQLAVPLDEVKANFARYGLLDEQVVFVKGFFDQTLPALDAGPFALLRLDGDMYESTIVALESLYPRLSPGGFVIIDDYGAVEGCRLAVDSFRRANGITAPLETIDWTGVWWRKPAATMPEAAPRGDLRDEHVVMTRAFERRCGELGLKPDPRLFWYHTIDLGDGLVTPGSFDYRALIDHFGLPRAMQGLTALDVGSATGFFAFEMERRGASVVSVELPSLERWDCFPGESTAGIIRKIRERLPYHSILPHEEIAETFRAMSDDELHRILLDGPFRFCHQRLNSRVERVYTTIYELGSALSGRHFDLVMLGDILVHSINPLEALASAARVCSGDLVIADNILGEESEAPALRYIGGDVAGSDLAEWWRPNLAWFQQVLRRLGFRDIRIGAPFEGRVRPGGETLLKRVIHARR